MTLCSCSNDVVAFIDAAEQYVAEVDRPNPVADFLEAEKHPAMMFRSTGLERKRQGPPEAGEEFTLRGELTIRGITHPVTLECTYEGRGQDPWGGERVSFSGKTKIDRRQWGLTWNQALETGGVLVSNDLKVNVEVQATREQPQA